MAAGMDEKREGVFEGRNAVAEAIRSGVRFDKAFVLRGASGELLRLAGKLRASGAVVVEADRQKLDAMSQTQAHQGVIALASAVEYAEVPDLLRLAEQRGEPPLIVVCNGIEDPRNLGAIIRAAECAGAHGVVISKRHSATLTAAAAKASAGAVFHLPVARVANIPSCLKELKKQGLWVFGAEARGTVPLYGADLTGPAALVIGSEGAGLSRLTAETCDVLVSIPMRGKLNSLNASAACAILLYEALRQRAFV